MAALLRSGKFLRMVTGLTRQQVQQPSQPAAIAGPAPSGPTEASLAIPSGFENTGGSSSFQTWSLQHLQGALPALSSVGCVGSSDRERENKEPLLEFLSDTKVFEAKLSEVEPKESPAAKEAITSQNVQQIKQEAPESPIKKLDSVEDASQGLNLFKSDVRLRWEPKEEKVEETPREIPEIKVESDEEGIQESAQLQQQEPQQPVIPQMVPVVPLYDSSPEQSQWYPLPVVCQMFRQQGRYWDLECLLEGSRGIRPEDRKMIYFWTLQSYADAGLFDRAVALSGQLHLEGLGQHFPEYHQLMSSFAAAHSSFAPTVPYSSYANGDSVGVTPTDVSLVSSPRTSCSSTPAPPAVDERRRTSVATTESADTSKSRRANVKVQVLQRKLKKSLSEENIDESLKLYYELEQCNGKSLNITELSTFIELLVKDDRVTDATVVAGNMLSKDMYPMPKIFRFLLNKLASNGDVAAMTNLGQYLTSRVKKEVSFDNRLCNAYLASGRGAEYLEVLTRELNEVIDSEDFTEERIQSLKDKFPRGGAMGLLESDPNLVDSYTDLAHKFLKLGYIAPMNVLWTYHFIGGRHDLAMPLWEKYVKTCPQIMFQKVCQTARATSNADLAQRLVNLLENADTVTVGARGIAYSCLLDVLTQRQEFSSGVKALKAGLESGISIEDVNRTALKRLKEGLEATTNEHFPFEIPKKSIKAREISDETSCHSETETTVAKLN